MLSQKAMFAHIHEASFTVVLLHVASVLRKLRYESTEVSELQQNYFPITIVACYVEFLFVPFVTKL